MSMLPADPTVLLVPDQFRAEYEAATEERRTELHATGVRSASRRLPRAGIVEALESRDWSPALVDWYVDQITLYGPYIDLEVPVLSMADQERWESETNRLMDDEDVRVEAWQGGVYLVFGIAVLGLAFLGGFRVRGLFLVAMAVGLFAIIRYAFVRLTGRNPHLY
jgi:hypothetical protein